MSWRSAHSQLESAVCTALSTVFIPFHLLLSQQVICPNVYVLFTTVIKSVNRHSFGVVTQFLYLVVHEQKQCSFLIHLLCIFDFFLLIQLQRIYLYFFFYVSIDTNPCWVNGNLLYITFLMKKPFQHLKTSDKSEIGNSLWLGIGNRMKLSLQLYLQCLNQL